MKVFLAGGSGLLGSTLSRVLVEAGYVVIQHSTTGEYAGDFRKPEQVFSILDRHMPDAIINLIGMASVDGCEKQPDLAYQLNAGCLENIVDWVIARNGGPLIHISTDHVYDSKGLNVEDNVVLRNMYAMTKRCAELFAQRTNGVVLRTNFFGVSECKERVSFSDWLVSCMLEGKKTNLFNDVYFSPLTMQNFSELIRMILEKPISGVYNVGSINGMSKRDFAFCLAKHLGLNTSNFTESSILETPFKERPRFMEMDCNLFQNTYKISLPTLEQQIQTLTTLEQQTQTLRQNELKKLTKNNIFINYARHEITSDDIDAVVSVLKSDYLTQGPEVPNFEQDICNKVGSKYAVGVNSATSALHIACIAIELGPGDILWTSSNTFVASANCAQYCGAKVDFIDINPHTWNISTSQLEEKLKEASEKNTLPKAIVAVHFAGQPTDQDRIWELSKKYGFKIIEDASHALGASRNGEPVGSCKWSDLTIFSFHPVKAITSGEGGMALTNNESLFNKMMMLRTHGITSIRKNFVISSPSPWHYEQQLLGFNYRMNDIEAALGRSQLKRLDKFIEKRNYLAHRYNNLLRDLPIKLPMIRNENYSAFHIYVVLLELEQISKTHQDVFEGLRKRGIGVNVHYAPVHLHPYYRELGFTEGQYTEAESFATSAITIPLYSQLLEEQQNYVVESLTEELL